MAPASLPTKAYSTGEPPITGSLNEANLGPFLFGVPDVLEVSIGHALIGDALYRGLDATVKRYLDAIARGG